MSERQFISNQHSSRQPHRELWEKPPSSQFQRLMRHCLFLAPCQFRNRAQIGAGFSDTSSVSYSIFHADCRRGTRLYAALYLVSLKSSSCRSWRKVSSLIRPLLRRFTAVSRSTRKSSRETVRNFAYASAPEPS